jgi:hypothetical protein
MKRFAGVVLLMLAQPGFLIPLMIVDELFERLNIGSNLNIAYYFVPFLGKLSIWASWEAAFAFLFVIFETVYILLVWAVLVKGPLKVQTA